MTFALVDTRNGDVLAEFDSAESAVQAVRALRLDSGVGVASVEIFVLGDDGRYTGDVIGVDSPRVVARHPVSVTGAEQHDGDRPPSDAELRLVVAS